MRGHPRAIALAIAMALAILPAGCGGSGGDEPPGGGKPAASPTARAPAAGSPHGHGGAQGDGGSNDGRHSVRDPSDGTGRADGRRAGRKPYDPSKPDAPGNDKPPPKGSPAERFERTCKANPSACD